jgi:hypothetical protein
MEQGVGQSASSSPWGVPGGEGKSRQLTPGNRASTDNYEGGADQPAFGVASAPLGQARIEPAKETPGIAVSIPRSAAQEAPQSLKESRTPTSIPARTRPPAHTTGTRSRE